jgi:hypothetical protein
LAAQVVDLDRRDPGGVERFLVEGAAAVEPGAAVQDQHRRKPFARVDAGMRKSPDTAAPGSNASATANEIFSTDARHLRAGGPIPQAQAHAHSTDDRSGAGREPVFSPGLPVGIVHRRLRFQRYPQPGSRPHKAAIRGGG